MFFKFYERTNILYRKAMGYDLVSSAEAVDAVHKLAASSSTRSTEMLLRVATSPPNSLVPFSDVREAAAEALGNRGDPFISARLARMLTPEDGLNMRTTVARSLQRLPCESECVAYVLKYMERVRTGEVTSEDQMMRSDPTISQSVRISIQQEQNDLDTDLRGVLLKNPRTTIVELEHNYNLGKVNPSVFAVKLAAEIGLRGACPALEESERRTASEPPGSRSSTLQAIDLATSTLQCH